MLSQLAALGDRVDLGHGIQVHSVFRSGQVNHWTNSVWLGPLSVSQLDALRQVHPIDQKVELLPGGIRLLSEVEEIGPEEFLLIVANPEAFHRGGLAGLNDVVTSLMEPGTGCPWDLEQTHETLKKFLLEESYELFEAIDRLDESSIREEIGDVLLQPMMHAQIKAREGSFDLDAVGQRTAEKLVGRHPHVFGTEKLANAAEVLQNWESTKKKERGASQKQSMLDGVPKSLPSLARSMAVSQRVVRVGFEWPSREEVWSKLHEEIDELRQAEQEDDIQQIEMELGDVLFSVVQIARWHGLDAEEALRKMVTRFERRFAWMEAHAEKALSELTAAEWDALWTTAKSALS